MKKTAIAITTAFLVTGIASPAFADDPIWSEYDSYTPSYSYDEYDVLYVGVEQDDSYPEMLAFHLQVDGPIYSSSFSSSYFEDYAGISIDLNLDGEIDALISTNYEYVFEGDVEVTDVFYNDDFVDCYADYFYLDDVITFRMDKVCLPFGDRFGFDGFANNGILDSIDIVPDTDFVIVNNVWGSSSNGSQIENPVPAQPSIGLPSRNIPTMTEVVSAGSAPDDLVKLSSDLTQGIVQLTCGNAAGTGFAIVADLSDEAIAAGNQSYLVSNHHVIEGCENTTVFGTDAAGNNFTATVVAYDRNDDVAGLVTSQFVPPLEWAGEKPKIGWWVGAIGNPYELRGALTTGNVSQVLQDELVVTAALNPGNSGGPVFDREGRVLGVATAIRVDSQNIGYAGASTLICTHLVECSGNAWQTNVSEATPEVGGITITGDTKTNPGERVSLTAVLQDGLGNPISSQGIGIASVELNGVGRLASSSSSFNSEGELPITVSFSEDDIGFASIEVSLRVGSQQLAVANFEIEVTEEEIITTPSEAATSTGFWTSRNGNNVKVYAKNFVGLGKVQIFFNGEEIAWANPQSLDDPKLRVVTEGHMAGASYLVRDRDLEPGKNVFEIYLNGERVERRVASR